MGRNTGDSLDNVHEQALTENITKKYYKLVFSAGHRETLF